MNERASLIEKGIPLPGKRVRVSKYPWELMCIGDSLLFRLPQSSVSPQVTKASRKTGFKFQMRKTAEGIRVWRVS